MRTTASGLPVADHGFHQIFFRLGKIDAGSISAEKSRFAHRHFFAFELTGDSDDGDDGIGIFRSGDGFLRRSAAVLGPDQFGMRLAVPGSVGDFERDLAALFEVDAAHAR